jgi:hypothetical protein
MTPDEARARETVNRILSIYPTGITGGESADRLVLAIAAALRAQRPRWRKELPKVAGPWIWRSNDLGLRMYHVRQYAGEWQYQLPLGEDDEWYSMDMAVGGEWAPVVMPEEGE